jgi:Phasin protein
MAGEESRGDKAQKSSLPNLLPPEFAAMGKQQVEALVAMQAELLKTLQDTSRNWFDRMQLEATLASQFAAKLSAARSIPEAASVYQEWAKKCMQMAAEDAKRLVADSQKLAETGTRLLSSGWPPGGRGGST